MTAPAISRIDDVLTALAALATTALAAVTPAVEVMDGPQLGELPWRHLMFGITDSPDTAPYTTRYARQDGLGAPRYVEEWEVRCGLCLAHGNNDIASLRAEVVDVMGLLDTALRAAHTGPAVPWDEAGLGESEMQWYPVRNQAGATVLVFFSLEGASLL